MVLGEAALPIKKSSGMPRRACKMKDSAEPFSSLLWAKAGVKLSSSLLA